MILPSSTTAYSPSTFTVTSLHVTLYVPSGTFKYPFSDLYTFAPSVATAVISPFTLYLPAVSVVSNELPSFAAHFNTYNLPLHALTFFCVVP